MVLSRPVPVAGRVSDWSLGGPWIDTVCMPIQRCAGGERTLATSQVDVVRASNEHCSTRAELTLYARRANGRWTRDDC